MRKIKLKVNKMSDNIDWACGWADKTLTAADIYAGVDSMTTEQQLAEVAAFLKKAADDDICAEIFEDHCFQVANLLDEEEVHLRCYVAMIRARDRLVTANEPCGADFTGQHLMEPRGQIACYKFDGLVCPEHRVTFLYDPCFNCGGCGQGHAGCECGQDKWEERTAGQRIVIMG